MATHPDSPDSDLQQVQVAVRVKAYRRPGQEDGANDVFFPATDGGYVRVSLRKPQPALFKDRVWSTSEVMAKTRARARALGLGVREFEILWDADTPADLARWRASTAASLAVSA